MNAAEATLFSPADLIAVYTRSQAIEDGTLVDLSEKARGYGFALSTVCTRTLWASLVEWTKADSDRQTYQDESGRLHDLLWMGSIAFRQTYRRAKPGDLFAFRMMVVKRGGRGRCAHTVKVVLGYTLTDDGQPAVTLMLPGEN